MTVGHYSIADLIDLAIARALVDCTFTTAVAGDRAFNGSGLYTNVGFNTSHEGEVTWSSDVLGSGPIVSAVIV
jgi:hypothetical protein